MSRRLWNWAWGFVELGNPLTPSSEWKISRIKPSWDLGVYDMTGQEQIVFERSLLASVVALRAPLLLLYGRSDLHRYSTTPWEDPNTKASTKAVRKQGDGLLRSCFERFFGQLVKFLTVEKGQPPVVHTPKESFSISDFWVTVRSKIVIYEL